MRYHEIEAKSLSQKTGIPPETISRYRNGRIDIGSRKLITLIRALPDSAQFSWFALIINPFPPRRK